MPEHRSMGFIDDRNTARRVHNFKLYLQNALKQAGHDADEQLIQRITFEAFRHANPMEVMASEPHNCTVPAMMYLVDNNGEEFDMAVTFDLEPWLMITGEGDLAEVLMNGGDIRDALLEGEIFNEYPPNARDYQAMQLLYEQHEYLAKSFDWHMTCDEEAVINWIRTNKPQLTAMIDSGSYVQEEI